MMKGIASISGALVFGTLLVGSAFLMQEDNAQGDAATTAEEAAAVASAEQLREYQPTKDSDGDGISDWKEMLAGTDPQTPNEPEEVSEDPDDILSDLATSTASSTATTSEPKTFTDQFARSYIEDLIRAKHGPEGDGTSQEDVVNKAVRSVEDKLEHTTYSPNDLSIIQNSDLSDVRTYGNELGSILRTNVIPSSMDPYAVILKGMQDEDQEMLDRLTVYTHAFSYLRDEILALPVPHTLVQEHLVLINTFSIIHDDFVAIRDNVLNDPLLGFGHLMSLMEHMNNMSDAIAPLRTQFEERDIYYTSDEPGTKLFDF